MENYDCLLLLSIKSNHNSPFSILNYHPLSQHDIKNHHEDKTGGKANYAYVGVFAFRGFGDKLLDNNVDHSSCRKGQKIRQHGRHHRGKQNDYKSA